MLPAIVASVIACYFCIVCFEGSTLVQAMPFGDTLSFDKLDKNSVANLAHREID